MDFYLKQLKVELDETNALLRMSGGDARKLLNILELVVSTLVASNPGFTEVNRSGGNGYCTGKDCLIRQGR